MTSPHEAAVRAERVPLESHLDVSQAGLRGRVAGGVRVVGTGYVGSFMEGQLLTTVIMAPCPQRVAEARVSSSPVRTQSYASSGG